MEAIVTVIAFLSPIVAYILYRVYRKDDQNSANERTLEESQKEAVKELPKAEKETSSVNESIRKQAESGLSWEEETLKEFWEGKKKP